MFCFNHLTPIVESIIWVFDYAYLPKLSTYSLGSCNRIFKENTILIIYLYNNNQLIYMII